MAAPNAADVQCNRAMRAKFGALKTLASGAGAAEGALLSRVTALEHEYGALAARSLVGGSVPRPPLSEQLYGAFFVQRLDALKSECCDGVRAETERLRAAQAGDAAGDAAGGAATKRSRQIERRLEHADAAYDEAVIVTEIIECAYDECGCGANMSVDEINSHLVCEDCGEVRPLKGVVFNDNQLYAQEGQKTKSGRFDPLRHLRTWLNNIQAINVRSANEEEVMRVTELIREKAQNENEKCAFMTAASVRRHLKGLGKTSLNQHVALLMKNLTKRAPPQLPAVVESRIIDIFTAELALEDSERLAGARGSGRSIHMYYPNYIVRILDEILPPRSKYREIMDFIYVPNTASTSNSDLCWLRMRAALDPALFEPIASAV